PQACGPPRAASSRSATSTVRISSAASSTSFRWAAAWHGSTPARTRASSRRPSSSRPSSAARGSRSPAPRRSPTAWASSAPTRCARWRSPSRRAATASTSCASSKSACCEGDPHRDPGRAHPRAEGLRRRAGILPRELQQARVSRRHGSRRRVRAGQPLELAARRAARPALPDQAGAGQAGACHCRRSVRRRGRPAAQLGELRQVRGLQPRCGVEARRMDPAGLRARVPRALGAGGVPLQDHRLLRPRARARAAVERPGPRHPLAAAGRAGPRRARSPRRVPQVGRNLRLRILLIGKNGQVGSELCRSLCRVAELTALGRSDLDLTDPEAIRRVIRAHAPDVIINAAAYTAVDRAEVEEELAMRVNGVAPGIMAEEIGRNSGLLVHYSTDYVFDGTKRTPYEEHDVPNPINAYGRSKLEGERRIRAANCAHLIFRTSWVYNASGNNFLCTMLKLARDRTEIRVVDDQCGAPTWARTISETTTRMLAGPTGKHYPTG